MSTTIIQIVDNGANCKYKLSPSTNMLGRRYDNNADFIQVQFPEVEIQSGTTCIMMVEDLQGNVLDHIEVKNNELTPIYNNISQNISVNIGFYFSGDNNYIKNSEYQLFRFCDALKPDGFVPVEPVQSGNIDKLIQQGVIDVRWKDGTNNVLEIVRLDSKNNTELELSPFVQEQSNLAETDTSSETFVKNKSTKYLENEGEDGSSPYATEKYVDEHSVSADAVLYTPQTLTEEQQAQARTNIGVTNGEPIAEAIRDNATQIVPTSGGLKIGGASTATLNSIAIGRGATVSQTNNAGIAIGRYSNASALLGDNIAIGDNAIASGRNSIQLGRGTNNSNNSLQIKDDNIYNYSTHTLTVQNIEQDGNPVYGILSGDADPTTETVGKQFQFYVNTTSKELFQCMAVTTTDATTYTWQQVGGVSEKKYLHQLSWVYGGSSSSILARADIISNSKDAFTEETLYNWLINNGYTSSTKYYIATGNQPVIQSVPPTSLGSWFIVGILANPNRPNKIWYQYGYTVGKYDTIKINNVSSYVLNNLGAGNTNNTFSSPPTDTVIEL